MSMGSSRKVSNSYSCDQCNRSIKVSERTDGMNITYNCNITAGCHGRLHKILNPVESSKAKSIPESVTGLDNWSQRRLLYNHIQRFASTTWRVQHNLQTLPDVHVFIRGGGDANDEYSEQITPKQIELVDGNVCILHFDIPRFGLAQCVTTLSQLNEERVVEDEVEWIQISNRGALTIAHDLLTVGMDVDIVVSPSNAPKVKQDIQYADIRNVTTGRSAWYGASEMYINNRTKPIGSFDVMTPTTGMTYMTDNRYNILSVDFTHIPDSMREYMILMSNAPYTQADRIYDQYVDISLLPENKGDVIIQNGEMYIRGDSKAIRYVYPAFTVNQI